MWVNILIYFAEADQQLDGRLMDRQRELHEDREGYCRNIEGHNKKKARNKGVQKNIREDIGRHKDRHKEQHEVEKTGNHKDSQLDRQTANCYIDRKTGTQIS